MDLRLTIERVSANFFLFIGVPFLSIERRICRRGLTMSKDVQTPGDLIAYHRVSCQILFGCMKPQPNLVPLPEAEIVLHLRPQLFKRWIALST